MKKTATRENIVAFAEKTEYKSEITKKQVVIYFHEGNGHNFRVKWKLKAGTTEIVRYYTNGWLNRDIDRTKIGHLSPIFDHVTAENAFHQPCYH